MKIILFGKNGQIGSSICNEIKGQYNLLAFSSLDCNILNFKKTKKMIVNFQPDIIINAAAYTAVDQAEIEKDLCSAVNVDAVSFIANLASKINAFLIHFSTDYVFDGLKEKSYIESDVAEPINYYGKTKLKSELEIINTASLNYIILRTSWIFNNKGKNFLNTIRNLIKNNQKIKIVNDQFGSPTSAKFVAQMVGLIIIKFKSSADFEFGLYHLSSNGRATWYSFAEKIIKNIEIIEKKTLDIKVMPLNSKDYKTLAKRPQNSVLSNERFEEMFDKKIPHWHDQLFLEMENINE